MKTRTAQTGGEISTQATSNKQQAAQPAWHTKTLILFWAQQATSNKQQAAQPARHTKTLILFEELSIFRTFIVFDFRC